LHGKNIKNKKLIKNIWRFSGNVLFIYLSFLLFFNNLKIKMQEVVMQTGGWIMMLLAWGIILGLCAYCFYRLFKEKR
jgi:uncharacterized membrane protein